MATTQTPEQAIEQALLEQARTMAEGVLSDIQRKQDRLQVTMDYYNSACSAHLWYLNSRRMRCYPQAFSAALSIMLESAQIAQQVKGAPTGALGIEMASHAHTYWFGTNKDIDKIEPLLRDTIDDLDFNSHYHSANRIYNESTYEIFNLFGGIGDGMLNSAMFGDDGSGMNVDSLFGNGSTDSLNQMSELGAALNGGQSQGFWGFFTGLLFALFAAIITGLAQSYIKMYGSTRYKRSGRQGRN